MADFQKFKITVTRMSETAFAVDFDSDGPLCELANHVPYMAVAMLIDGLATETESTPEKMLKAVALAMKQLGPWKARPLTSDEWAQKDLNDPCK